MADIKELGKSVAVTYGLIIAWSVLLVMGTWVGAEIYFEFQHVKRENIRLNNLIKTEILRVEGRLDKKTKRNEDNGKEISDRVTILELPNSDK